MPCSTPVDGRTPACPPGRSACGALRSARRSGSASDPSSAQLRVAAHHLRERHTRAEGGDADRRPLLGHELAASAASVLLSSVAHHHFPLDDGHLLAADPPDRRDVLADVDAVHRLLDRLGVAREHLVEDLQRRRVDGAAIAGLHEHRVLGRHGVERLAIRSIGGSCPSTAICPGFSGFGRSRTKIHSPVLHLLHRLGNGVLDDLVRLLEILVGDHASTWIPLGGHLRPNRSAIARGAAVDVLVRFDDARR